VTGFETLTAPADLPADPSPSGGLAARSAYTDVLLVFAAFFGVSVVEAILLLAGRYAGPSADASWSEYGPAALQDLARAGLAVAIVILVARRRGLTRRDLGLAWRRDERGRVRGFAELRVAALAIIAFSAGAVVTRLAHGSNSLPVADPSAANLVYECAHSFESGVMEEVVVLGLVVALLRLARRPVGEILAVAVLLRMSYHLYYGTGVVGIAVWAAVFVWLFWRTRSLLPLIVVHVWWDTVLTLARRWPTIGGIGGLVVLVVLIVCGVSWAGNHLRKRAPTPALAPAGWYRDPVVTEQLRWRDGSAWHPTAIARPLLAVGGRERSSPPA
jgi:hypothetical protein